MLGTLIEKMTYDLGLAVAANFATCGLPTEVQEYYLQNKNMIPEAILRGFVFPQPETKPAPAIVPALPTLFKTAETDVEGWLSKAEEFAKKYFGVTISLREHFVIPAELPWKSVIPVFDPGGLDNRGAVQKALKDFGLAVWEEVDVMKYSGSQANKEPTLHFIQNSIRPDDDTMGSSPNQLVAMNKNWLGLRGYALAFAVHHFATSEHLDLQTWTWFPANRLADGRVANGRWFPDFREVRFSWDSSDYRREEIGSRLAIPVPLLP